MNPYSAGLLARLGQSTKAAREQKRKKELEEQKQRIQETKRKEEESRNKMRMEVEKMVRRNSAIGRIRKATTPKNRNRAGSSSAQGGRRVRSTAPTEEDDPFKPKKLPKRASGPPKPMPGMEFVVRKTKKKEIRVPHPSDYSDMFGKEYLLGIDLKVTSDMAKESAEATAEAQHILKEKKELADRLSKQAKENVNKERDMMKKGILNGKTRDSRRIEASSKDWVAVNTPVKSADQAKAVDLVSKAASYEKGSSGKARESATPGIVGNYKERGRLLKERLLAMGGGPKPVAKSTKPVERARHQDSDSDVSPERSRRSVASRPSPKRMAPKRRRCDFDDEPKYEPKRARRPVERGYNSDEWSDDNDNDNDKDDEGSEEDLYGIEALDREEERSRRLGALEDKRERQREIKRKLEKERRRKAYEGSDS